ncbi:MAG: ATP-binding cassette domain-containing protein [Gammaproteobacteria bacterium]|nr:ATP-binding cassette domain-containing protein [Gammaproteobacteria bacterium]
MTDSSIESPNTEPVDIQQANGELAVDIRGLKKSYQLYRYPKDRLKEAFHPFKKKYHQEFNALDGIDFSIPKGTTVGIIGRNGSGKSTLLQCICGIVNPTGGEVRVKGKIAALLELGAGFNPEFTGRDNLYMNAAILGLTREETDQRLEEILAFADIGEYIDQPVRAYSSGMYVRLAFSIAIHVDPEILIVDEALAVGDIHFQAKCFDRFHQFRKRGVTVIFVTHDLNMVTRYCDQAYLLNRGKLIGQGKPREVVAEYRKLEVNHGDNGQYQNDQESALFATNPYEVRYGNSKAKIIEGGIFDSENNPVQTLSNGDSYRVNMKVEFENEVDNPVFAYTIKDVKGTEIAGTNTHFSDINTGVFKPGEVVDIDFDIVVPLNAGSFLLSIGCVGLGGDQIEVFDRRHDFIAFQVITSRASVGIVELDTKIRITRH